MRYLWFLYGDILGWLRTPAPPKRMVETLFIVGCLPSTNCRIIGGIAHGSLEGV